MCYLIQRRRQFMKPFVPTCAVLGHVNIVLYPRCNHRLMMFLYCLRCVVCLTAISYESSTVPLPWAYTFRYRSLRIFDSFVWQIYYWQINDKLITSRNNISYKNIHLFIMRSLTTTFIWSHSRGIQCDCNRVVKYVYYHYQIKRWFRNDGAVVSHLCF